MRKGRYLPAIISLPAQLRRSGRSAQIHCSGRPAQYGRFGMLTRNICLFALLMLVTLSTTAQSLPDSTATNATKIVTESIQNKMDSLKVLQLSQTKYAIKVDSLTDKLDSLATLPAKHLDKLQSKVDSTYDKLENKLTGATSKIAGKVMPIGKQTDSLQDSLLSKGKELGSKAEAKVENINQTLQKHTNETLPTANISEKITGLTDQAPALEKVKELPTLPQAPIEKLKDKIAAEELKTITDQTGDLKAISNEAGKYKEDISAISKGNIEEVKAVPKYLEDKVKNIEGISAVENHKAAMDAQVAQVSQPKGLDDMEKLGDKDYVKQKAATQLKKAATDHFAKHVDKIQAAQGKLAKLKKKYGSLESMNHLPLRKQNPLKGKTLGERLTIGGNFQLYKTEPFGVDLSPQLAYQLTKKFSMGVGGTYRTGFDREEAFLFSKEKEAYGFKAYSEHDVYKSFFAHGEFERLHEQNKTIVATDLPTTKWNSNALVGIGKTYNFTKGIKGNVLVLYNFLNDKTDPYRRPWNIRFGFELKGSKKEKNNKEAIASSKKKNSKFF